MMGKTIMNGLYAKNGLKMARGAQDLSVWTTWQLGGGYPEGVYT